MISLTKCCKNHCALEVSNMSCSSKTIIFKLSDKYGIIINSVIIANILIFCDKFVKLKVHNVSYTLFNDSEHNCQCLKNVLSQYA